MKVLIIKMCPINDLSSTMIRTLALIKGLVDLEYDVDIFVMPANNGTIINNRQYTFLDAVNIICMPPNALYNTIVHDENEFHKEMVRVLRGIYHKIMPFDYTYKIAKGLDSKLLPNNEYDFLISDSDPKTAHIAMKTLIDRGVKYKKWIQYWGDPLAYDITNRSIYPKFLLKFLEKRLFSFADKIIYTSPFTLDNQKSIYKKFAPKMSYVPTAYIESQTYNKTKNEKQIISYTGAYNSRVRNIVPFYEACKEMQGEIECIITGNTDLELNNEANIQIRPRMQADSVTEISDIIVCIMNKRGTQIPGKLYHCASTNKKILVIMDGDNIDALSDFLLQWNRFYICKNDKDEIKKMIRNILTDEKEWLPLIELEAKSVAKTVLDDER